MNRLAVPAHRPRSQVELGNGSPKMRGGFRVARSSRVLAKASRLRGLSSAYATRGPMNFTAIHIVESSFRRDAETNTRDERATRNPSRHISTNSHL